MSESFSVRARIARGALGLSMVGVAAALVIPLALARPAAAITATALASMSAVHVAWAFGWKRGLSVATPAVEGAPRSLHRGG